MRKMGGRNTGPSEARINNKMRPLKRLKPPEASLSGLDRLDHRGELREITTLSICRLLRSL